jgi:hypothetical protein
MKVYYIGMDVHKKNIVYCIKTQGGEVVSQGNVASNRVSLRQWVTELPYLLSNKMIVNPEWLKPKEKPYFHQISPCLS